MLSLVHGSEARHLAAGLTGFLLGLAGVLLLTRAVFGSDGQPTSRGVIVSDVPVSARPSGASVWRPRNVASRIPWSRPPGLDVRTRPDSDRRAARTPDGTFGAPAIPADSAAALVETLRDRRLRIPVAGVSADDLRDHFLDPRGGGRTHFAIDIIAERSTPVLAIESGTIAHTDVDQTGGGIVVYQYGPSGEFVYYYAHLEGIADGLDPGDRVRPGQVIGYVGTTGNAPATVPHLHFAVHKTREGARWWRGIPLNPFPILR